MNVINSCMFTQPLISLIWTAEFLHRHLRNQCKRNDIFPSSRIVACTAALYSTDYERVELGSGISQIYVASLQSASWAVHAALVVAVAMGRMDSAALQFANRLDVNLYLGRTWGG